MFHGHLDGFQKPPLGGRPNTKLGDYGTPNAHNRWFILFCHVWGHAWIEIRWNSIWSRARSCMASHLHLRVGDHTAWFWRCVGTALGHFSFGLSQCHGHRSWLVCDVVLSDRIVWRRGVLVISGSNKVGIQRVLCEFHALKHDQWNLNI